MASCAYCNTTILFGGKTLADLKFCNDKCAANGQVVSVANQVPHDIVQSHSHAVFTGTCPVCNQQNGPVDVHTSHKVTSYILATSWSSQPRVSCRPCGRKSQIGALFYSLFLGWWGFPWGLLMTPVQVGRNLVAALGGKPATAPSTELQQMVRMSLAAQAIESNRQILQKG